ncbi:MAG TPA: ABC transporter ATP-binding protein [Xanthomonadales bacterium]|nr:ABC transporter ATP-binding protein [Xanthomonadales bacterium]
MTDYAIDVRGLSKSFGDKKVVDGLDLRVERGAIYGFLGPNGSGKTTTIRMLCGLLTADAGEGTCLGLDVRRDSALIKCQVGYMTQKFTWWEDLTIEENLRFAARMHGLTNPRAVVDGALERLGLAQRRKQLAGELSGGWKQRLALAACLLHQPKLLLLDEPTAGVDPKARRDFWAEIHALARDGLTVLVSTHYMDEAERCHRLAYIALGKLLAEGTPQQILAQVGLSTFAIDGAPATAVDEIGRLPGVEQVVPFGLRLHVSGVDARTLSASVAAYVQRNQLSWEPVDSSLEDAFIALVRGGQA